MTKSASAKLNKLTALKDRIAIYVPSTVEVDKEVSNEKMVNSIMKAFSKMFGGCTAEEVKGGWVTEQNNLVIEKVTKIYSNTIELNDSHIDAVIKIANIIKDEMKQEAVAIEINSKLYLI